MVKNREELLRVAQDNANQLKAHLRRAITTFLTAQRVTVEELAYVLGLEVGELEQVLRGDGNITVNALSKLLVATDMAVEIKPVSATPMGFYGDGMPRGGGFPSPNGMRVGPDGIPVGPDGRPLPPPPGFPGMPFGQGAVTPNRRATQRQREERAAGDAMPPREANGRFAKKRRVPTEVPEPTRQEVTEPNPYNNIPDGDLINIIRQNLWDGEIDLAHATHQMLADFVFGKEQTMRRRNEEAEQDARPERPTRNLEEVATNNTKALNNFIEMLGNIAREAQNNPQVMETIQRFMPQK